MCGLNCTVHVSLGRFGHTAPDVAISGVHAVKGAAVLCITPLSVDQHLVVGDFTHGLHPPSVTLSFISAFASHVHEITTKVVEKSESAFDGSRQACRKGGRIYGEEKASDWRPA
jgi:hypothetical protein